jgi:hypothetical protein
MWMTFEMIISEPFIAVHRHTWWEGSTTNTPSFPIRHHSKKKVPQNKNFIHETHDKLTFPLHKSTIMYFHDTRFANFSQKT